MIVRTVVAYCDATDVFESGGTKDCFSSVSLNPQSTQSYIDLRHLGWKLINVDEGIKTVCPNHKKCVEWGA